MRSVQQRHGGRHWLFGLTVVVIFAAACGGGASPEEFKESLMADGFSEEEADCVLDGLEEVGIDPADLTDDALGDDDPPEEAVNITVGCLTGIDPDAFNDDEPAEADAVADEPVAEEPAVEEDEPATDEPVAGGSYGDDPAMDALWDACEAGDGAACDELYWTSPVDSEYEEFGNLCGNRHEVGPPSCEDAMG